MVVIFLLSLFKNVYMRNKYLFRIFRRINILFDLYIVYRNYLLIIMLMKIVLFFVS